MDNIKNIKLGLGQSGAVHVGFFCIMYSDVTKDTKTRQQCQMLCDMSIVLHKQMKIVCCISKLYSNISSNI